MLKIVYGQIAVEVSVKNQDKHFKLQMISLVTFCKNYLRTYNRVDREGNPNERSHKGGDVCLQKEVLFCHIMLSI